MSMEYEAQHWESTQFASHVLVGLSNVWRVEPD